LAKARCSCLATARHGTGAEVRRKKEVDVEGDGRSLDEIAAEAIGERAATPLAASVPLRGTARHNGENPTKPWGE
jgi:hypothetical protein